MAITQEDGGRLNAFAKEPRMELIESGQGPSRTSLVLLVGGAALVLLFSPATLRWLSYSPDSANSDNSGPDTR